MPKIYTKTGDKGKTALFGGKRVPKNNPQIQSYGAIDELSSFIGVIIALDLEKRDIEFLTDTQRYLYEMMSVLCGATVDLKHATRHVLHMEEYIDEIEKELPPLNAFILPQGTEIGSWFHVLRTVCRRAERDVVSFDHAEIMRYLNRLSDLFFVLARKYNKDNEVLAKKTAKS